MDLLAARGQMAVSLAFHILFAVAGMAMPVFMVAAEWKFLRTGRPVFKELAQRWAKGTAILFAVGAVSGTVLSFELGLLWPRFIEHAGPVIGMPFSLEGFAFFLEAIFLGIYLYGWERVPRRVHLASGVIVAVSGLASGVFVLAVNSWMNSPTGFTVVDGQLTDIDVVEAFFNPSFPTQALHMALAAYLSVAFVVLGIHASRLRKDPKSVFHKEAMKIAFVVAAVAMPLQLLSGDLAARHLVEHQPVKFAAMEAHFETQASAPFLIGGWADVEERKVHGAIELPYVLSLMAHRDPNAVVTGLEDFPEEDWPPVPIVHAAFDVMTGSAGAMVVVLVWGAWIWIRRRDWSQASLYLRVLTFAAPLGLIALEAGWVVTEVGRQPWIIRGVMRTAEAVTPMPYLVIPFAAFTLLYVFLGVIVILLLRRHVVRM